MRSVVTNTQLRLTAQLIKEYGRDVTLFRPPPFQHTAAGGVQRQGGNDTELDAQRVYFGGKINNRMNNIPFEQLTTLGEYINKAFVLVGMPTEAYGIEALDVQEDDYFYIGDHMYYITFVDDDRTYQVKCEVEHRST